MPSYPVSIPQLFFGLKIEVSILTLHNIKQFTTTFYFVFVVQLTALYTQDSLPSSLNLSIKLAVYIIDFYPMTVGTTDFIHNVISFLHSYI